MFASLIGVCVIAVSAMSGTTANAAQNATKAGSPSSSAKSNAAAAEAGNAERGKDLFIKNGCYECHGYDGQGGSYTGPRIAPDPLPWDAIAAFIRNPPGVNSPVTKDSAMPPYTSKMVPDKDVQDIHAYLKSIAPGTNMKNIPTYKK